MKWFADRGISVVKWPPRSPDLNPIENLWNLLDLRLRRRPRLPGNVEELWKAMQEEWGEITQAQCENLVESLPRRYKAVVKAKGWETKY